MVITSRCQTEPHSLPLMDKRIALAHVQSVFARERGNHFFCGGAKQHVQSVRHVRTFATQVLPFSIFWHNNPKNTPKIPQKYLRNTSNIQSIVMGFSFSAALFFIYLFIYYKCTSEAHDGSEIMKEFSRPNIWRAF